jgi:hypothetical protein
MSTDVKVEIGFSGPSLATAFHLDNPVFGLLDSGILGIGVTLVDLSDRAASVSIRRGRQNRIDPVQSGRATVILRNNDGLLDPLNTASALYPGVEPRRPINLYADSIQVYAGFVDDIDLEYTPGGDALVRIEASDGLSRFALADFPSGGETFVQEDSGARIQSVLNTNSALWTGATSLDAGDSQLGAGTASGNVLEYLQLVERSEGGFFFVSRDGTLSFRNRNNPAQNPGALTLSDASGTGVCTPYVELARQAGIEDIFNEVTAVGPAGTAVATDADSIDTYGIRDLNLSELLLATQTAVDGRVEYEVIRRANAYTSVRTVTVDQSVQPGGCGLTLIHDLGDSVEVVFSPPGVAQQIQTSALVGVAHQWTVGRTWRTTFTLTEEEPGDFLILDDVDYGRLGVGALAF